MVDSEAALEEFDLLNPSTFLNGHPFDTYDALRGLSRVHRHPGNAEMDPFWLLTGHQDVHAVSHDTERFTNEKGFNVTTAGSQMSSISEVIGRNILGFDPPDHTEFRRALMPAFSGQNLQNLQNLEKMTREFVRQLLDALPDRAEIDFVKEIAEPVPIRALCTMLGIPPEDEPKILSWTNKMVGAQDPEVTPNPAAALEAYMEVFAYGKWLIEKRRENPGDDLMSLVAHVNIEGAPISDATRDGMCATLIAAGNETTRNGISGAIMLMTEFPEQRAALVKQPELMPNAVAELLRRYTPIIHMLRTAKQDLRIQDQPIAEGERVALLYGAANHDPDVFEDPYQLNVERENARSHVAFGSGPHFCLGARIAQMEMRIVLEDLLARFPNIETTDAPTMLRSNFVHGIRRLPVRLA